MLQLFHAKTADEAWGTLAGQFAPGRDHEVHDGRGGRTYELLHVGLSVEDPRQRWVVCRQPPLNVAFALAEVIWILGGRRDAAFLSPWNSRLPEFVGNASHLHGAYGHRLRHHFGYDQLARAFSALQNSPESRQVVLQLWDPAIDFPAADGAPRAADVPCNVMSIVKVRRGRLEWMQIVRSNDLFLGVPYNLVQFTFLQEVLAGWLRLEPGTYNQLSDSLHVYERDLEAVRSTVTLERAPSTDRYDHAKDESDRLFAELAQRVEHLTASSLSPSELLTHVRDAPLPEPYLNMLRILTAEAARRRRWMELADETSRQCTNPALTQLWTRWASTRSVQST